MATATEAATDSTTGTPAKRFYTPPEIAKLYRVKPAKIIAWIRSGTIRGFDVSSTPGFGRPRYRVSAEALAEFEARRDGKATPTPRRRRRQQAAGVLDIIK